MAQVEWTFEDERKECGGTETDVGSKKTLSECAKSCRGTSSMFIYGTNDFGDPKCTNSEGCSCYCEISSRGGECNKVDHNGYRLYKYKNVDKGTFIITKVLVTKYRLLSQLYLFSYINIFSRIGLPTW